MPISSEQAARLASFSGTAVVVGGTAGIGRGFALQLALLASKPCTIVIVGRNEQAASSTFDLMRSRTKVEHNYRFEQCDATTLANVRATCAKLIATLDRLDMLVITCGVLSVKGRTENNAVEHLDVNAALVFYSRMLFVRQLLPLLEQTQARPGANVHVVTVLNSTWAPGPIDFDDLELTKSAVTRARRSLGQGCAMNNVAFEDLAHQHPTLSFMHSYPGWVKTDLGKSLPFGLRQLLAVMAYFKGAVDPELAGERILNACLNEKMSTGFWRIDEFGEAYTKPNVPVGLPPEEARRRVTAHLDEVCSRGV